MEEDSVTTQETREIPSIRKDWWLALLFSLAIPVCVLVFFLVAPHWLNAKIRQEIAHDFRAARDLTPQEQARQIALFTKLDFNRICLEKPQEYTALEEMFERSGTAENFRRLRWGLDGSSALLVALAVSLGSVLWLNRRARQNPGRLISSFRIGWRLSMGTALLELLLLVPLLSYALFEFSVLLMEQFFIKLLIILISAGGYALWFSIKILLKNVPLEFEETLAREVTPAEAPTLWAAVREAARQLQTAPPDHIIIGMQLNFYVTEMNVKLASGEMHGRTLFLSHPLIKYLSEAETLSVIGHELGHFIGEDTRIGREFHPMKFKANATMATLNGAGWTGWTSLQLLRFFTICFAETEQAASRRREFLADKHSAALTSTETVARALIRVNVFSAAFEIALQDAVRNQGCSPLETPLRAVVANRLIPEKAFWKNLFLTRQPHPLDSHPSLQARMDALNQKISAEQAKSIALIDEPSAFDRWLAQADSLFAGVSDSTQAAIRQMQHQTEVVKADARTDSGRALLEAHFPEIRWNAKYPIEAVVWLVLGGLALSGAFADLVIESHFNLFIYIAGPLGTVFLLKGTGVWKHHKNASLILDSQGLRYTTWVRALAFEDVQSISAVKTAQGLIMVLGLKKAQQPIWIYSFPIPRKTVTFLLSRVDGDSVAIIQTVASYLTRQLAPKNAR
ncbi:MAG: M48 family metallopeptidase [Chthoniobacteraceae bacterium]